MSAVPKWIAPCCSFGVSSLGDGCRIERKNATIPKPKLAMVKVVLIQARVVRSRASWVRKSAMFVRLRARSTRGSVGFVASSSMALPCPASRASLGELQSRVIRPIADDLERDVARILPAHAAHQCRARVLDQGEHTLSVGGLVRKLPRHAFLGDLPAKVTVRLDRENNRG